jgi:4-amino-4-deoxy-L-arabinose transferase-like glycosyltransferase
MKASPLQKIQSFLETHEYLIPLVLFLAFLAVTLPGISWGYPNGWHPDEIVMRAIWVLRGEWKFSEINFDYPDLPQYVMLGLGKLVLAFGYAEPDVRVAARVLSAILAGLTIVITYKITRRISGNIFIAGLSGLMLLSVSAMSHNGRFAHNDPYIAFFVALAVMFLVNYRKAGQKGWLYASFITVGMAASSKYNGISLVAAPALVYLIQERKTLFKELLHTFETIFIGGALTFLGFAIGTPKAFFWMTYYFKRMIPALLHTGNYARQPDSVRGIVGQYSSFAAGTGQLLYLLFIAAFLWAVYKLIQAWRTDKDQRDPQAEYIAVILLSILVLDLPVMISYNYVTRFFLPIYPLFAILGALFVGEVYQFKKYTRVTSAVLAVVVLFSFARNISVMLLFMNDARIPASAYVKSLPLDTSLEYMLYPPAIPRNHFSREHNYPVFFKKSLDEQLPTSKKFIYNDGEHGLYKRQTDYLVADSFTTDRLSDPYICDFMPAECDFFQKLATGQSDHYKLIAEFKYSLPRYLPQMSIDFVNPSIRIYERIK